MYINIEVKAPHEPQIRERYDYRESIRLVHMHIVNYDLEGHCCVSSFDHDILEELDNLNQLHTWIYAIQMVKKLEYGLIAQYQARTMPFT